MIKFQDIKIGDYLQAEYEGKLWEGEVIGLQHDQHLVQVLTNVQDFWFEPQHLYPIPLTNQALLNLNFLPANEENGVVKYVKGAFRIVAEKIGDDLSHIDMWYREDKRHNPHVKYVHELQNQYLEMTKVPLIKD
jgi:hypothetical protein